MKATLSSGKVIEVPDPPSTRRLLEWDAEEERLATIRVPAPLPGVDFGHWLGIEGSPGDTFGEEGSAAWCRVHLRFDWEHVPHESSYFVKLAVGEDYHHVLVRDVNDLVRLLRFVEPVIRLAGSIAPAEKARQRAFAKARGWDEEEEEQRHGSSNGTGLDLADSCENRA